MRTAHLSPDDNKSPEKLAPRTLHTGEMRGPWLLLLLVAAANAERVFVGYVYSNYGGFPVCVELVTFSTFLCRLSHYCQHCSTWVLLIL